MKILTLFLISLILLTSCKGQNSNQQNQTNQATIGKVVDELGSSAMVIYQDKKNVYWFGSWDGDLLIGYMSGTLQIPFKPAAEDS